MNREKERNKSFYDKGYFELLEAMKENTCPVCFLIKKSELSFMNTLFYEFVNDSRIRRKLRYSLGFCRLHAHLAIQTGTPLGIAIIYEDITLTIKEKMKKENELFSPGEGCLACKMVKEVEEQYIRVFLKNFSEKNFQDTYRNSFGLCMPHFLQAYLKLPKKEKKMLKECQLQKLENYVLQLQDFIRKHEYRFSHEEFGEEAAAWKKVVEKIVGEHLG
ncbi:hypothetical protein H5U35_10430 [Candidatus Aerophobetes bacterium]|nr:hypothetical protein [Candidatus Aerophobetes bacterium]